MHKRAIMIVGTGSDVGKSLIVAGLARVFARRGLRVRPFKPQNMSNNAAVTPDGGEIGRAQALQARAAGATPSVDMNPVLLKPQSDIGSQVVVRGKVLGNYQAAAYQKLKPQLMGEVIASFERLMGEADLVLIEGAGSPAEINLRRGDFANMGFARALNIPVVIVGDIDRGGVIASLAGTKLVLPADDAAMIRGFIINKFRGDPALFEQGMVQIAELTGWQNLGLVSHFSGARKLPAEDAVVLDQAHRDEDNKHGANDARTSGSLTKKICVLQFPLISNFDDFDPLAAEPMIDLEFVKPGSPIPADADLVILPGSKAVIADFKALVETGWDIDIKAHVRRGGSVLGICGGYQMLGDEINDVEGIEGPPEKICGLGLLDVQTVLTSRKSLRRVEGTLAGTPQVKFSGFEMHVGRTIGPATERPMVLLSDGRADGATSSDGLVSGCYVHGLFVSDEARQTFLRRLGGETSGLKFETYIDTTLNDLADHLEHCIDCDALLEMAKAPALKAARTT